MYLGSVKGWSGGCDGGDDDDGDDDDFYLISLYCLQLVFRFTCVFGCTHE